MAFLLDQFTSGCILNRRKITAEDFERQAIRFFTCFLKVTERNLQLELI